MIYQFLMKIITKIYTTYISEYKKGRYTSSIIFQNVIALSN